MKRRQEAEKRRQEEEAEKQKQEAQRKEQEEAAKLKQQQEEAERKRKEEEERNKKPATAEEQLLKTADEKFKSETDKSEFKNDMDDFQNRARARNLPQQEIDKTYGQVNRLLQEGSAAVPEEHRQLAAKTLMHQLGRTEYNRPGLPQYLQCHNSSRANPHQTAVYGRRDSSHQCHQRLMDSQRR
ncbi:MAG: hypothetical protein IPK73_08630 [Candidatus Obscuribacter sp.]|nr:hypothetical protein [Candidatus Obscuribacter sp.]